MSKRKRPSFTPGTPPGETIFYGDCNRFLIRPFEGRFGYVYFVHDAAMVTDEEVKAGKGSPAIGCFANRIDAVVFCKKVENGSVTPEKMYND